MGNEFRPAGAELANLRQLTATTANTLNALAQKDAALATTAEAYAQAELKVEVANNLMSGQRAAGELPFSLKPLGQYSVQEIAAAQADGVNLERQLLANQKALNPPLTNLMVSNDSKALRAAVAGDEATALGIVSPKIEEFTHSAALEAEMKTRILASQSAEVRALLKSMATEGMTAVRLVSKAAGPLAVAVELYHYQDGLHDKDVSDAAIAIALEKYERNHRVDFNNVPADMPQGAVKQEGELGR